MTAKTTEKDNQLPMSNSTWQDDSVRDMRINYDQEVAESRRFIDEIYSEQAAAESTAER